MEPEQGGTPSGTSRSRRYRLIPWLLAVATAVAGAERFVSARMSEGTAAARVELGRHLFFDPRLSRTGLISCASCHDPRQAFTDGRVRAVGLLSRGDVNTPTLANISRRPSLMVVGAIASLEEQATKALVERGEMGALEERFVVARVQGISGYARLFEHAFGDRAITMERVAAAIAAFERTLLSGDSDYDRFVRGEAGLSPDARVGSSVFFGKGRCAHCHAGQDFTDDGFHATGSTTGTASEWRGRQSVTFDPRDAGKIRTPTLRDVSLTAPYFHDGSMPDLESVVRFYESGGRSHPNKDPRVAPIELSDRERRGLVAFLRCLEGRHWIAPPPARLPED